MVNLIHEERLSQVRNKLHEALIDQMYRTRDPFVRIIGRIGLGTE